MQFIYRRMVMLFKNVCCYKQWCTLYLCACVIELMGEYSAYNFLAGKLLGLGSFIFDRDGQIALQISCIYLHSHQEYEKIHNSLHMYSKLLYIKFSKFLDSVICFSFFFTISLVLHCLFYFALFQSSWVRLDNYSLIYFLLLYRYLRLHIFSLLKRTHM